MRLSVVTPCSRPENLAQICPTVPAGAQWIVVLDRPNLDDVPSVLRGRPGVEFYAHPGGLWGNEQRNHGMWQATGEFLYFLDDDNVVHPRFEALFAQVVSAFREPAICFNQVTKKGVLRMRATSPPRPGGTDTAQVVLPRAVALGHRWVTTQYDADGRFFAEIFAECPERWIFIDEPAAYYNYLRGAA